MNKHSLIIFFLRVLYLIPWIYVCIYNTTNLLPSKLNDRIYKLETEIILQRQAIEHIYWFDIRSDALSHAHIIHKEEHKGKCVDECAVTIERMALKAVGPRPPWPWKIELRFEID